jgi:hypothetical protein
MATACNEDISRVVQMLRTVPCTARVGCDAIASAAHRAASCSSAAGTTSETSPIWWARCADMRSWLPSSESRMISPSGMRWPITIGSKTAAWPKVVCGSKKVAVSAAMRNSTSPSM